MASSFAAALVCAALCLACVRAGDNGRFQLNKNRDLVIDSPENKSVLINGVDVVAENVALSARLDNMTGELAALKSGAASGPSPPSPGPSSADCQTGAWTGWSACVPAQCGGSYKWRTRPVTQDAVGSGAACPVLSEREACGGAESSSPCVCSGGAFQSIDAMRAGLAGCTKVTGALTVAGITEKTDLAGIVSGIEEVGGTLQLFSNYGLVGNVFSKLKKCGGMLLRNMHSAFALPALEQITGDFKIEYSSRVPQFVKPLAIGGYLRIDSNAQLLNVDGLSGVTSIGGYLFIYNNAQLLNVNGLSAVTSIGGYLSIYENGQLLNVDGLSAVISIGMSLQIGFNRQLLNVDGLSGVTSIGGYLHIHDNAELQNVDGLSGVASIRGHLDISTNAQLLNVDGLSGIISIGGYLMLTSNTNLKMCPALKSHLITATKGSPKTINVPDQTTGC